LRGKAVNWFAKFETTQLVATWDEVRWVFISRFNGVRSEGQVVATLRYAKLEEIWINGRLLW
jgi:hypothetical protein